VSHNTCKYWFYRFKDNDFDMSDHPRSGTPQKLEANNLEALLNENPSQAQEELAEQLEVDQATVSRRLHKMGKIQKLGKWVPHELSQNSIIRRLNTCVSLLSRQRKKVFCGKLLLAMKSGLCMTILNANIHEWTRTAVYISGKTK
jgi:hypothetical protein